MQTLGRVLAAIGRAFAWAWAAWIRDISGRKSKGGKAASIGIGLLVICCGLSAVTAAVRGTGERVGLVPTRTHTATRAPTARPTIVEVDPTERAAPTATTAPTLTPGQVTHAADATIIDEGDLRSEPRLGDRFKLGLVCPGDAVAILERGTIWHRVQVVTIGESCGAGHASPGSEGWVAFQNVQLPTATPRPSRTPRPTEPATVTREATATPESIAATAPVPPRPAVPPTARPTTPPEPTAPRPTRHPLNTGGVNRYNCDDFGTWQEADAVYQANLPGDPNRLDNDDDGIPCENLPGSPVR